MPARGWSNRPTLEHLGLYVSRPHASRVGEPTGPMVLSGGDSTESWRIHADAIEGILTRFDRG